MASETTARMRRGVEATWQGCGWPTRGSRGAQGADTLQEATRVHAVHADARVGRHVARRGVGIWRAHGLVGPGKMIGAVTQLRYTTPIFTHVISTSFFREGLCSHTIVFCRLRGGRAIVGFGQDDDDCVDPSPRDHQWSTCGKYRVSGCNLRAYLKPRGDAWSVRSP